MKNIDLTNIDFYEARERFAITELYKHQLKPLFINYNAELHLSHTFRSNMKNEVYDAVIYLRDKITTNILYKFIIEVKYRDTEYETLILEKKRYNELFKTLKQAEQCKAPSEDITVLYINFTPSGTYIFNLCSNSNQKFLNDKLNLKTEKLVQYTFETDKKEINKKLYYLPKHLAKHFKFVIDSDYHLIYNIQNQPKVIEKQKQVIKRIINIF